MLRHVATIIIGLFAAGSALAQDTLTIRQIQEVPQGGDISLYNGQTVITGGIVSVGPAIFPAGLGAAIYIEDHNGGIFSGIKLYCPDAAGFPTLLVGDSIICAGTVNDNGMTELLVSSGDLAVRSSMEENDPMLISAADIDPISGGDSLAEPYEGVFVRVTNFIVDSVQDFSNADFWYCHNYDGHCIIKVESDSIPDSFIPPPGSNLAFVQGVVDQISGHHYVIKPRYMRDMRFWANNCIGPLWHSPEWPTPLDTIEIVAMLDPGMEDFTLFYTVDSEWTSIPMIEYQWPEYRVLIGPLGLGATIRYYFRATDNQGTTCYSPYEAPSSFYSLEISPLGYGNIAGIVRGNAHGPLRNVYVDILNSVTGARTDSNGYYQIDSLPPGSYSVRFDQNGYNSVTIPNATVADGQTTNLDISLDELCDFVLGDANASLTFNGMDIVYEVKYFKGEAVFPSFPCYKHGFPDNIWYVAGDLTNDCVFSGPDITYGVRYFKGGSPPLINQHHPNGAVGPYGLVKGNVSWPGHYLGNNVFVVTDTILPSGAFSPWSRNLINTWGDRDYNLLVSSAPHTIAIYAFDDVDTDGFLNPDAGDGWGFYDANNNGIWDIGDTLTVQPGQIIRNINIQLTPFLGP
jgi:hypothetical protein